MSIENSVINTYVANNIDATELKLHIGQKRRHMYRRKNAFKKSRKRQRLMKAKDIDLTGKADMDMSKNLPDGFLHYDSWRNRVRLENRSNSYKVKRPTDRRRLDSCQTKVSDYAASLFAGNKPYADEPSYEEQQNYCWYESLKRHLIHYGATRAEVDSLGVRELLYLASKAGVPNIDSHLYEETVYLHDDFGGTYACQCPIRLGEAAVCVLDCITDSLAETYWF